MAIPSNRCWDWISIWNYKRININEDATGTSGVIWRIIYAWIYVGTKELCLWDCTGWMFMVQVIYQDCGHQVRIKPVQVISLSIIHSKKIRTADFLSTYMTCFNLNMNRVYWIRWNKTRKKTWLEKWAE